MPTQPWASSAVSSGNAQGMHGFICGAVLLILRIELVAAASNASRGLRPDAMVDAAITAAAVPAGGITEDGADSSVDHAQPINAFNDKLDSLKNEGNGLYYEFMTAESNRVLATQVEGRPGTWATETTPFPLASLSKLFTALAVMRTMEVKPKDFYPHKFVNEFAGWESFSNFPVHGSDRRANLTVHHLLTHTSGLPFGMRDSRRDIQAQTLFFWPGTAFGYTLGHRVLGWILRDFWKAQPETQAINIDTVQDTFKWLIFDELGLSCSTRFSTAMNALFGYTGEAGDAAIQSTGEDLIKLAVVALRRGKLPNGRVMISRANWDRWAVPNLLPGGKLSKDLVSWNGAAASWANWNVGGLKAKIMQQSGDFGWNYFGATYYDSKEIGWCGFFSSCLHVTYPEDLAFVMMQQNVADLEKSKPYMVANFASMAKSLQCQAKKSCWPVWEKSSIFCERCSDSCQDDSWNRFCPFQLSRGKALYPDTYWTAAAHTCYVPHCSGAPAMGDQCPIDTGGTCRWLGCDSSRGPTTCVAGACLCQEGLCASEGKCQPRAELSSCCRSTGGTCHLLGCDASRGATCVQGSCVCAQGLCAEAGHCVPPSALALAGNASRAAPAHGELWLRHRGDGAAVFTAAVSGAAAAGSCAVALGVLVRWRRRRQEEEQDMYSKLLES